MGAMEPGSSGVALRRVVVAVAALTAAFAAFAFNMTQASGITWADVTEAEAEASRVVRLLTAAEGELDALAAERDGLLANIARLEERGAEIAEQAVEEGASIKDRLVRMYMAAGAGSVHLAVVDMGSFATRVAYLGAISQRDRELVIQFSVTQADLEALRRFAEERLEVNAERATEVEAALPQLQADADAARSRLASVRAQWERFEAAQAAAAEAELRRQEAELSQGGSPPTTSPAGPGTTTTTVPQFVYNPSAGVEQWRPLVNDVFTRWGLAETTCATRNGIEFCVGPQVGAALSVIQCESSGNPMAVNSRSGTAGLFQNHPAFWQDRVNRIRSRHSDKEPNMPADASIFNPEYNIAVGALMVWESKQVLLGRRGGGGIGGSPWPEFNFNVYTNGNPVAYGYSVWGKGPNPWGHWVGCAATRGVNALGDSGPPFTYPYGRNLYDSGWIHPWAQQQTPP